MFVHEVKQIEKAFQSIKWTLRFRDDTAREDIEVKNEMLQIHEGVSSYEVYENETGEKLNRDMTIYYSQLDLDVPRLTTLCDGIIVHVIRNNASVVNITSIDCNNDVEHAVSDNMLIRSILTYICFSVSVVSLLLLIVVYRKIGMTSTIPGSNLQNISISLVMSNCLFMVGVGASDIWELCFVIGVFLHHLWLSVFYFMSIAILCIVINLTKLRSNDKDGQNTFDDKKCFIVLGGVIVPCLFVGPAIVLDIYGDAYLASGYGKQPCFPHIFPADLIFFSVLLAIAVNFVCMLRVIYRICKLSHEIRHVSMSTPYTYAKIYLRILALSGFFWITGIVAAILESEWINYLFTLLCGLQGFFISLASLTTRQVIQKLKY